MRRGGLAPATRSTFPQDAFTGRRHKTAIVGAYIGRRVLGVPVVLANTGRRWGSLEVL